MIVTVFNCQIKLFFGLKASCVYEIGKTYNWYTYQAILAEKTLSHFKFQLPISDFYSVFLVHPPLCTKLSPHCHSQNGRHNARLVHLNSALA